VAILFEQDPPRTPGRPHTALSNDLHATLGARWTWYPQPRLARSRSTASSRRRPRLRSRNRVCALCRFEVRLRKQYFDMEPIRKLYRAVGGPGNRRAMSRPGARREALAIIDTCVADIRAPGARGPPTTGHTSDVTPSREAHVQVAIQAAPARGDSHIDVRNEPARGTRHETGRVSSCSGSATAGSPATCAGRLAAMAASATSTSPCTLGRTSKCSATR